MTAELVLTIWDLWVSISIGLFVSVFITYPHVVKKDYNRNCSDDTKCNKVRVAYVVTNLLMAILLFNAALFIEK